MWLGCVSLLWGGGNQGVRKVIFLDLLQNKEKDKKARGKYKSQT